MLDAFLTWAIWFRPWACNQQILLRFPFWIYLPRIFELICRGANCLLSTNGKLCQIKGLMFSSCILTPVTIWYKILFNKAVGRISKSASGKTPGNLFINTATEHDCGLYTTNLYVALVCGGFLCVGWMWCNLSELKHMEKCIKHWANRISLSGAKQMSAGTCFSHRIHWHGRVEEKCIYLNGCQNLFSCYRFRSMVLCMLSRCHMACWET